MNPKNPTCPRCWESFPMSHPGAMSRVTTERDVEICSPCGLDEGLREARGMAPIPLDEWPVDPFTRLVAEGYRATVGIDKVRSRLDLPDGNA